MTYHPLERLRARKEELDGLKDLDVLLGFIAKTSNPTEARRMAEANNASPRVLNALTKATVPASDTSGFGGTALGSQFGEFYSQARNVGVADAMAQFAVRLPRGFGRFNIMSNVTASTVAEGAGKPARRLNMSTTDVTPSKGVAQIVFTKELLDGLDAANATQAIRRELMRSITGWTDGVLLAALVGNSSEAQSVDTVSDFLATDFEELFLLVGASSQSQLFLITTPAISKSLAAHLLTLGVNVSWPRFEIGGVAVIPSDQQTQGRVTLVDAAALAMYLSPIEVRSSEIASLEMSDTPVGTSAPVSAQNMVSLFGSNSVALLAERWAAIKPLTSSAHAHLTGVGFGQADSPSGA